MAPPFATRIAVTPHLVARLAVRGARIDRRLDRTAVYPVRAHAHVRIVRGID